MTDLRQAAQQALDAWDSPAGMKELCVAMDTFRAALEQQAEPPEWLLIKNILDEYGLRAISFVAEWKAAQQQAEPVAWLHPANSTCVTTDPTAYSRGIPLYTAPPQRQWVGLTDEDYLNALDLHPHEGTDREFWNVLEAKLKEKNNDPGY